MLAEFLDVFLADFGVACSAGGHSFTGILDTPDETLNQFGVNVLSTMYQLTAKTADVTAAAIASGSAVTANGWAYTARDVELLDDGAFTRMSLSK